MIKISIPWSAILLSQTQLVVAGGGITGILIDKINLFFFRIGLKPSLDLALRGDFWPDGQLANFIKSKV